MSQAWHPPTPGDQIKRDLAKAIALIIDWRELKQVEAARLMCISPSKLSVLLQYARDSTLLVIPASLA